MNKKLVSLTSKFFNVPEENFTSSTVAADIKGWDSLAHASYIIYLEENFEIEFDVQDIMNMDTFGNLSEMIENKLIS